MSVIEDEERKNYYEAFSAFDWNNNGKISYKSLLFAMRRAGVNPTEVEVHDIINRLDNGTGVLSFDDFLKIMMRKNNEVDQENYYKEAFRVFFKDEDGCVPAEELKDILRSLHIPQTEVDEMIHTVDRNGDGKISYSEFRVMLGAIPLLME